MISEPNAHPLAEHAGLDVHAPFREQHTIGHGLDALGVPLRELVADPEVLEDDLELFLGALLEERGALPRDRVIEGSAGPQRGGRDLDEDAASILRVREPPHATSLDQSIDDEYCHAGELPAQIERVRAFYRGKRGVMLESLKKDFGGRAQWTSADGGLFTFVTMNDDIDTAARVEKAVGNGVAFVPGAPFFVDGSGRNTMRLTFAKEPDARIREGVRKLAEVFTTELTEHTETSL